MLKKGMKVYDKHTNTIGTIMGSRYLVAGVVWINIIFPHKNSGIRSSTEVELLTNKHPYFKIVSANHQLIWNKICISQSV